MSELFAKSPKVALKQALLFEQPEAAEFVFAAWRAYRGNWQDVAAHIGVSVRTLYRWRATLPVLRPVRPGVRYRVSDDPRQLWFSEVAR